MKKRLSSVKVYITWQNCSKSVLYPTITVKTKKEKWAHNTCDHLFPSYVERNTSKSYKN